MQNTINGFSAEGIVGSRKYHISMKDSTAIIVGPNGTGKSTFLSLFYLFISRQWTRLAEYDFDKLTLSHSGGSINLTKIDLLSYDAIGIKQNTSSRYISKLFEANLSGLVFKPNLTAEERKQFSEAAGIASEQVPSLRKFMQSELSNSKGILDIDRQVQALDIGPIMYLPTYRRIEKDIKSIFPDIETRLRSRMEETGVNTRSGAGFKEIASFGMADVQSLIKSYFDEIRDFQRVTSDTASQEYIRDIIRGEIRKYSLRNLRDMDEAEFEEFKERLDANLFSASDREGLWAKIADLRQRTHGQPSSESRYLGMFVEKLLAAHQKVKEREAPLRLFVTMVSKYLGPSKLAELTDGGFSIFDARDGREILLEKLSSGEKQIVSMFAYLILSRAKNFFVFIDEPELSLSVPWQKTFLPDLIETGNCEKLVVVTHSPFVFDNHLKTSVIDVRRLTETF